MTELTYEEKVTLLENLFLEKGIETFTDLYYGSHAIDIAIATVAKYTPTDSVHHILEAEEWDVGSYLLGPLASIVQLWYDVETVKNSSANLLNLEPSKDWKVGYNHELAKYLVAHGRGARLNESFYGWQDYEMRDETPVAVLSVFTEHWGEFVGTFTGVDQKVGIAGIVVYADGKTRKMRAEGEFADVMREITASVK